MDSLSSPHRREALLKIGQLCVCRREGLSEEETSEKLGFGSVEAMHLQLPQWGLPSWIVGEDTTQSAAPQRRPRGDGVPRDLPPAVAAIPLFEEAIGALQQAADNLGRTRDIYKDRRFISTSVYNDPTYFSRSVFSEEEWRRVCELFGHDPDSDGFLDTDNTFWHPTGGSPYPPRPLVTLIAAYALSDGRMRELLRALHPAPAEADVESIDRLLHGTKREHGSDGLLRVAEQIAALVRGGQGKPGAPPPELSAREHNAACLITHRRRQGWADERILEELHPEGFTKADVSRLGRKALDWPTD